jgi:hypothetical protein
MKTKEMTLEQIVEELDKNEKEIIDARNGIDTVKKKLTKAERRRKTLFDRAKALRVNGLPLAVEGYYDSLNGAFGCPYKDEGDKSEDSYEDEENTFEVDLEHPFSVELDELLPEGLVGKYLRLTVEEVPVEERKRCEKCSRRFECLTKRK